MHINTWYNGVEIHREKKSIYAKFLEPHLVLSTCRVAGGIRDDLKYVLNHQSCEPCKHTHSLALSDPLKYREKICKPHNLIPEKCATMGTAANMHHAAFVQKTYKNLVVAAVITGGVETNAGRAGDPASVFETVNGFERLDNNEETGAPVPGTINIMLFIGHPLTKAALTRTIMMATEAKTVALQELAVNSRYSSGLATGTGTDQIIVAAPDRDGFRLGWAGKHGKLGELIATATIEGVKETLAKQNNLTPQGQCSSKIHLERFGSDTVGMIKGICEYLNQDQTELLGNNFKGILRDPLTVAAIASMAHVQDKLSWNILPASCRSEVLAAAAAQVACSISLRFDKMHFYREKLGQKIETRGNTTFLKLCWQAMALGFRDKWPITDKSGV